MSVMFLAGDKGLFRTGHVSQFGRFYKNEGFGRLPDCEELVRGKITTPLCFTFKNDVEQLKPSSTLAGTFLWWFASKMCEKWLDIKNMN